MARRGKLTTAPIHATREPVGKPTSGLARRVLAWAQWWACADRGIRCRGRPRPSRNFRSDRSVGPESTVGGRAIRQHGASDVGDDGRHDRSADVQLTRRTGAVSQVQILSARPCEKIPVGSDFSTWPFCFSLLVRSARRTQNELAGANRSIGDAWQLSCRSAHFRGSLPAPTWDAPARRGKLNLSNKYVCGSVLRRR